MTSELAPIQLFFFFFYSFVMTVLWEYGPTGGTVKRTNNFLFSVQQLTLIDLLLRVILCLPTQFHFFVSVLYRHWPLHPLHNGILCGMDSG